MYNHKGNKNCRIWGVLLCAALCISLCAGCTQEPSTSPSPEENSPMPEPSPVSAAEGISYENEALGLVLTLPASWEGNYGVLELNEENTVEFYQIATREEMGEGMGNLFWITRYERDTAPEENQIQSEHIILSTDLYVYMIYRPSDVQYSPDTPSGEAYEAMVQDIAAIEMSAYFQPSAADAE